MSAGFCAATFTPRTISPDAARTRRCDASSSAARVGRAVGLLIEGGVEHIAGQGADNGVGADEGGLAAPDGGRRAERDRLAELDGVAAEQRDKRVAQPDRAAAHVDGKIAGAAQ